MRGPDGPHFLSLGLNCFEAVPVPRELGGVAAASESSRLERLPGRRLRAVIKQRQSFRLHFGFFG